MTRDRPQPRLTHPRLAGLPGIAHGFFTRQGGTSNGIYASLNCGIGSRDDRERVLENRARVAAALGVAVDALAAPYQIHGTTVAHVETAWPAGQGPKADGVVTDRPGLAIAVGTADCGPVLFADADAGVVGAAHAGWKGAVSGVLEATLDVMENLGARRERVVAVLGPTISAAHYEVGPERVADIVAADAASEEWFSPSTRDGHAMFDLPGYIKERLDTAGLGHAAAMNLCTYADPESFYSYRRATHRGEPDYGRMLAAIALSG